MHFDFGWKEHTAICFSLAISAGYWKPAEIFSKCFAFAKKEAAMLFLQTIQKQRKATILLVVVEMQKVPVESGPIWMIMRSGPRRIDLINGTEVKSHCSPSTWLTVSRHDWGSANWNSQDSWFLNNEKAGFTLWVCVHCLPTPSQFLKVSLCSHLKEKVGWRNGQTWRNPCSCCNSNLSHQRQTKNMLHELPTGVICL